MANYSLGQLAELVSATLDGNAGLVITGIASLGNAQSDQISFLTNTSYLAQLAASQAGAVILRQSEAESFPGNKLIVADPYLSYARLTRLFDSSWDKTKAQIHPAAVIAPDVSLGKNISIGPYVTIAAGCVIGDGVVIGSGVSIGSGASVGANTRIAANVSIYHGVVIGADCVLHSGCVIGADGFGFAPDRETGGWCKIHQLGSVIIGNRVEIGALSAIDRGALENTEIHDGVIIDNQVHIAHNCVIGENTAIAANCGIAGSTRVGKNCTFAGAVGVVGHVVIGDNVHFTGMSMVTKSVAEPGSYSSGTSAVGTREWRKNAVRFNQLNELATRIKALENRINKQRED